MTVGACLIGVIGICAFTRGISQRAFMERRLQQSCRLLPRTEHRRVRNIRRGLRVFTLHPTLQADTIDAGALPLCQLLISRDANYPWFVLVPRQANLREAYELSAADQQQLTREVNALAAFLQQRLGASKMNVAALGNMVPQLHIHVIARFESDAAWPAPVWGRVPALDLTEEQTAQRVSLAVDFLHQFRAEVAD